MPGWASTFKLGRPRKELEFAGGVDGPARFQQQVKAIERKTRTASGEMYTRIFRKQHADFRAVLSPPVSDSIKSQLESMRLISDEALSLKFMDAWPIFSDRYVMKDEGGGTGLTIKLSSSPFTRLGVKYKAAGGTDTDIITIQRVRLLYSVDGTQADANLFSSYDALTKTITLTGVQFAGTALFVNWSYNGALVFFRDFAPTHMAGSISAGTPPWSFSLSFDGA